MSHYVLQTISIRGECGPITDIINFKLTDNSTNNSEVQSNEHVPEALPSSAEENQNDRSQKHMCNKCYKPFNQFNELKNHLAFCHVQGGYHLRKAEMLKNIEQIEKDATNMETNDICFCCGESYDTFHLGQINCDHCSKSFKTQMSYERHVFITHSEFDKFPCSICNAKLRTGHLLQLHEKQHKTRGRLFACKVCGKDFGRIDHLKRHQKYTACSASANDTISCKVCNKDFSRLDNLRKHLKHHLCIHLTKREKFMCPICKNYFYSLWNLNRHKRTHTGERPFACDLCEKKYPSLDALKSHRRSHTGEKPYICAECNHCFIDKKALNRHLMRHVCNICGEHFIKVTQLRYHIKTHLCPHACDKCEERFKTIQQLEQHTKLHTLKFKRKNKIQESKFKYYEYKTASAEVEDFNVKIHIPKYTNSRLEDSEKEETNCALYVKEFDSVKTLNSHILKLNKEKSEIFHKTKLAQKVKLDRYDSLPTKIYKIDDFNDNFTTKNNNATLPKQIIVAEEDTTDRLLLENEEYDIITLENETIYNESKADVSNSLIDPITSAVVEQFIKDEVEPPEVSTEQLLENEEFSVITLENKTMNTEPRTAISKILVDCITEDRTSGEGDAIQQFIKNEPLEASTEQLLENEEYSLITLENKTINSELRTAVPKIVVDSITEDRISIEGNAVVQRFIKDEPFETSTELLVNKEHSIITLQKKTTNIEPKTSVTDNVIDTNKINQISVEGDAIVQQFIKVESPEASSDQLLMNKDCCFVKSINESIKIEPKTIVRTSVEGIAQKCIKNEVSDATTEQLLLNNELYTITTLENKNVVTKSKTTVLKNLPKQNNYIKTLAESLVAAVTDPVSNDEKVQITIIEKEKSDDETKIKSNVRKLLDILVDRITLTKFGWPQATEEYVLCRVIENCGYDLSKDKTSYVDCDYVTRMRGYVKLLFSVVLHNESILELLNYYPIDDVIKFVLDNDDND